MSPRWFSHARANTWAATTCSPIAVARHRDRTSAPRRLTPQSKHVSPVAPMAARICAGAGPSIQVVGRRAVGTCVNVHYVMCMALNDYGAQLSCMLAVWRACLVM